MKTETAATIIEYFGGSSWVKTKKNVALECGWHCQADDSVGLEGNME